MQCAVGGNGMFIFPDAWTFKPSFSFTSNLGNLGKLAWVACIEKVFCVLHCMRKKLPQRTKHSYNGFSQKSLLNIVQEQNVNFWHSYVKIKYVVGTWWYALCTRYYYGHERMRWISNLAHMQELRILLKILFLEIIKGRCYSEI